MKTIKELKEIIKDLPDEMIVGGAGWCGEYLECTFIEVREAYEDIITSEEIEILCITLESPGEEPN